MFDRRDDGTIVIDFPGDGGKVTLPQMKAGWVEDLDVQRDDLAAELEDLTEQVRAKPTAEQKAAGEAGTISRDGLRKLKAKQREVYRAWWQQVAKLTGVEFPPAEDWPPYLTSNGNAIRVAIEWWQNFPLARGGKLEAKTVEEVLAARLQAQ